MKTIKKTTLLMIVFLIMISTSWGKYHPRIEWRALNSEKFTAVFPRGYETVAAFTLERAESLYKSLSAFWGMDIPGKIRIVLLDCYDNANGAANFFPFNRIEIQLTPPFPDSELAGPGGWISQVLLHELTHVFNLNSGSGFFRVMRSVFGNNPLFYPFGMAPVWLIEGFPVYMESGKAGTGRLNSSGYTQQLAAAGASGNWPSLASLFGEPVAWPGPSAKYFYGGWFAAYLAERYGAEKIPELLKHLSRSPIPLLMYEKADEAPLTLGRAFRAVFGKDAATLWQEFSDDVRQRFPQKETNHLRPLTRDGFGKRFPVLLNADTAAFVAANYREYPAISLLNLKSGVVKRFVELAGVNGMTASPEGHILFVTAEEIYKNYYSFSDLYTVDVKTGAKKRLTRGARLFHPSAAGKGVLCVRYEQGVFQVARVSPETGEIELLPIRAEGLAFPAESPDGKYIALSLLEGLSHWRLALFTPDGRFVRFAGLPGAGSYYPSWLDNSRLLFIQEYERNSLPAILDMAAGTLSVFGGGAYAGIRHLWPIPGGSTCLATFYTAYGFDLGELDLTKMPVIAGLTPDNEAPCESAKAIKTPEAHSYSPFPDLWPKYFTPYLRPAGNEYQPGLFLSGADATLTHQYSLEAYYGVYSKSGNIDFSYAFDAFVPTLTLRYRDLTDLEQTGKGEEYTFRDQLAEISLFYPLSVRRRSALWFYSSAYMEREKVSFTGAGSGAGTALRLNGFKAGWFFNSARRYYDALSAGAGLSLALSYARDCKAMGSDYNINTVLAEIKQYIPVFRPGVLALRLSAVHSWGEARRMVTMGGAESYNGFVTAGGNPFKTMRGYPAGFFRGVGGWLLNAEMRIPLFKIEQAFLWARSLERLYLTVFADVGNIWMKRIAVEPTASLGMELSLPLILGDLSFTLTGGCALGLNPHQGARVYFRLGNAF